MATIIPCSGNQPWIITHATSYAIVQTGVVNVYARSTRPTAGESGHLTFIGHASAGTVLVPFQGSQQLTFVAMGSSDATIEVLPNTLNNITSIIPQHRAGIVRWIELLLLACEPRQAQTSQRIPLQPDSSIDGSDGLQVTAQRSPVWISCFDVQSMEPSIQAASSAVVPVTRTFPATITRSGDVRAMSTNSALATHQPTELLACAIASVIASVIQAEEHQLQIDKAAFERRIALRTSAARSALGGFATITNEHVEATPLSSTDHNPLVAIARVVTTYLQMPLTIPPSWESTDVDMIDQLLEHSRIRSRSVILEGNWYANAGWPLVGFHRDGRIAALLQNGSENYSATYADGTSEHIDASNAADFLSNALQVYRPFPATKIDLRQLLAFGLRPLRKDLTTVLIAGVAGGLLSLFMPSITGLVFDQVIPLTERDQLLIIAFGIALSAIVKGLFDLTRNIAVLRIQLQTDASLQAALWDRLLTLPATFFRKYTAGELATRANGFAAIQQLISGSTTNSLVAFVFSIFQVGLLFYRNSTLAWYALLILALGFAVLIGVSYARYQKILEVQSVYQNISGVILQLLTAIGKLRATASENIAFKNWATLFTQQRRAEYLSARLQNVSTILNAVLPTVASMVFYWLIRGFIKDRKPFDVGDLLSFTSAFTLFWASMLQFVAAFESILMCVPLYKNASPIFDQEPEIDEAKPHPGVITGSIDFNGVTFRYASDGPTILEDVTFSVKPGEFVALVGPSGSGKSTILRLLLGFEQPEAGSIYVDGLDLRDVNIRSVRRQMGVVMQNGKVLSGDIGKNIIGASSTLTYDDAWEAARAAGFDEDIKQMPMGMHTVISEGGGALSGGQRQRLLISRALAGKPRIVLMDEATSALDNRTQEIVTASLNQMNVTRVIIAHRLSTVMHADTIIVLDKGRIVERGTFADLMAANGVFAALAKRQIV